MRDGPCRPNLIETYLDDCIMGFYTGGVLHFNSPTERKDVWRLGFCAPRLFLVRQRRRSLQHRKREAFHLVDELCGACAAGSRPATHLFSCRGIPCLCHHRCFVIASSLSFWKGPARRKGGRCLFFFASSHSLGDLLAIAAGRRAGGSHHEFHGRAPCNTKNFLLGKGNGERGANGLVDPNGAAHLAMLCVGMQKSHLPDCRETALSGRQLRERARAWVFSLSLLPFRSRCQIRKRG